MLVLPRLELHDGPLQNHNRKIKKNPQASPKLPYKQHGESVHLRRALSVGSIVAYLEPPALCLPVGSHALPDQRLGPAEGKKEAQKRSGQDEERWLS